MIRARLLALAVLAAAAVAACSSAPTASWTYAPASPATPAPSASAAASSAPAASASPAASAAASAATSPGASGGATGATVEIVAQGIAFTTQNVTAPAGQAFTLTFKNQDAGVPHNVHIKDSSGATVFKTDIFSGAADKSYQVGPLQAGTYPFVCDVHPNMTGTLTVK